MIKRVSNKDMRNWLEAPAKTNVAFRGVTELFIHWESIVLLLEAPAQSMAGHGGLCV